MSGTSNIVLDTGASSDGPGTSTVWTSTVRWHSPRRSARLELRRMYAVAVRAGANNTGCTAEEERGYGTPRLVTLALMRVVGPGAERAPAGHGRRARGGPAGRARGERRVRRRAAARHRALEIHGRDVGYEHGRVDRAGAAAGGARARLAGNGERRGRAGGAGRGAVGDAGDRARERGDGQRPDAACPSSWPRGWDIFWRSTRSREAAGG